MEKHDQESAVAEGGRRATGGGRFSVGRKSAVVMCLLRGEDLDQRNRDVRYHVRSPNLAREDRSLEASMLRVERTTQERVRGLASPFGHHEAGCKSSVDTSGRLRCCLFGGG